MEDVRAPGASVRVFVDGRGTDAPSGGTALDAVRVADPALADAVARGVRRITDSRGLDLPPDAPTHGGAVYRVLPVRAARQAGGPPAGDAADAAGAP